MGITKPPFAGLTLTRPLFLKGNYSSQGVTNAPVYSNTQNNLNIGYVAGIGFGIPITPNRTIYAEIRFVPHFVMYGATRLANSRSLQLTVSVPILSW